MRQVPIGEIELHLRFEGGTRPVRRVAAATLLEVRQRIGQGEGCPILEIHAVEPLQ
jgi:hypothetical protein